MSKTKEALKMCLEYIETDAHERKYVRHAIKEALAEQEQEPIGYIAFRDGKPSWDEDCVCKDAVYPVDGDDDRVSVAIYTHPAPANQPSVPDGYKLVPIKPTREMLRAWIDSVAGPDEFPIVAGYRAMLAAAPEANVSAVHKEILTTVDTAPEAPAWQELSKDDRKAVFSQAEQRMCREEISWRDALLDEATDALRAKNGGAK